MTEQAFQSQVLTALADSKKFQEFATAEFQKINGRFDRIDDTITDFREQQNTQNDRTEKLIDQAFSRLSDQLQFDSRLRKLEKTA